MTGDGDSWDDEDNWSLGSVPTAADRVVIPENEGFIHIDIDAIADTLDIGEGSTLQIDDGWSLTLENDDINLTCPPLFPSCPIYDAHVIDGTLFLEGDGLGVDAALCFTEAALHRTAGSGAIVGQDLLCEVIIEADVQFVNYLSQDDKGVRGSMTVDGLTGGTTNGTFHNAGLVHCTGEMSFTSTTPLSDTSNAIWWNDECKGFMEFNRDADLDGDFVSGHTDGGDTEQAQWRFYADIRTCGDFVVRNCGVGWDFGSGNTFEYGGFSDPQSLGCTNPGTSGGTLPCTNWVRNTNLTLGCV